MMDLVVQGRLVLGEGVRPGWVAVRAGRIAAIGEGAPPAAARMVDAGDDWVLPGIVDGQTHAGSRLGLAGIGPTTRSAAAGGVTTVVDMPYDHPQPLNTPALLQDKIAAIAETALCDMALYGTVMPGQGVGDVAALVEGGVCAFKISAYESSPTRFPRIPADLTLDLFEALAATDLPLGLHNEDQEIVHARIAAARAAGRDGLAAHSASRPPAAELAASAAFLELGATAEAHAHLVHLSTPRGFALVENYLADGARASGELCVHYLWFDPARDGDRLGALMKVNPPIRPGQCEALWAEIEADRVAFVSSDHSSWPVEGKHTPSIFEAGAGVPGVETLLPAFFTLALRHRAGDGDAAAHLAAEWLAERPARFFGLANKGALRIGADADITVLSFGDFAWDEAKAHDGLAWSPFHGERFAGRVAATFLRGTQVWDGTEITAAPGVGRYVPRAGAGWFAGD